jgi:hypothetical protein
MPPLGFGDSASQIGQNPQIMTNFSPIDMARQSIFQHIATANAEGNLVGFSEISTIIDNNLGENSMNAQQLKQEFQSFFPESSNPS